MQINPMQAAHEIMCCVVFCVAPRQVVVLRWLSFVDELLEQCVDVSRGIIDRSRGIASQRCIRWCGSAPLEYFGVVL